jgi:hypothetical protein
VRDDKLPEHKRVAVRCEPDAILPPYARGPIEYTFSNSPSHDLGDQRAVG